MPMSSHLVRLAMRTRSTVVRSRCRSHTLNPPQPPLTVPSAAFSSWLDNITGASSSTNDDASSSGTSPFAKSKTDDDVKVEKVKIAACGDVDEDEDDEMEQEEMFVEAYDSPSFEHGAAEWGGPRRGGRLPEPTRFGDWERKGRCSDF